MANETETLDSSNEDNSQEDTPDADALKQQNTELSDKNKQLFERAKKAEGELKGFKDKPGKPEAKESTKSDPMLLERLDNMTLQIADIKEADEVELANKNWEKYQESGGSKTFEEFIKGDGFQSDLKEVRTSKANLAATSNIEGERGESGARNTPEYWKAKATKGSDGQLLFPEEMPKELYTKVLNLVDKESGGASEELQFYNQK